MSAQLQVRAAVRLRVCARVQVPAVMGWLRPIILVPAAALSDLSVQQLEALLLHELAHVRRNDFIVNLLQTAVETLLFFHPAVWWVSRQVRQERENCCDDLAADRCGSRVLYARALAAMEELRGMPGQMALGARDGVLLKRVRRIVGLPVSRNDRWTLLLPALLIVATGFLLFGTAPGLLAKDNHDKSSTKSAVAVNHTHAASSNAASADASGIQPEDLKAQTGDYKISPGDLLSITLSDLSGPGKDTVRTTRATNGGTITLPFLSSVKAAGRTEAELEQDISAMYKKANVTDHMPVSVSVAEPRGRVMEILGAVNHPGQYAILDANTRLLDAIAIAHGVYGDPKWVTIMRPSEAPAPAKGKAAKSPAVRTIKVPAAKLLAGDVDLNIFVRPHDVIILAAAPSEPAAHSVELIVGMDDLTFAGKTVTWEVLAKGLEALPDHPGTVLNILPATTDVTVGRFFDARGKAAELVRKYGFKRLNIAGPSPKRAADPKAKAAAPGDFYIGGSVPRPGVYDNRHGATTLSQFLERAGGADPKLADNAIVQIIRHKSGEPDEIKRFTLGQFRHGKERDFPMQPGDQVLVGVSR